MQEKRCIVAQIGYTQLVIPLEHPLAGSFLSVMKGATVLDSWSGESKVTGKYEFNLYTADSVKLTIEDVKILTKEELDLHKNGSAKSPAVEGVGELKDPIPTPPSPPSDNGFSDDIPF